MKQPNKLTRNQKEILARKGLDPDEWMLVSESEFDIAIIHKTKKTYHLLSKH